jgi:hypothetical protein
LAVIREARRRGIPAILNDLTSVLNFGDVTLIGIDDKDYQIFEVKTSPGSDRKRDVQRQAIQSFVDSRRATTQVAPGGGLVPKEVRLSRKERSYMAEVQELIRKAGESGFESLEVEPGQIHIVLSRMDEDRFPANERTFCLVVEGSLRPPPGHRPLCLTLTYFEAWSIAVSDSIRLVTLIDLDVLSRLLDGFGLEHWFRMGEDRFLEIQCDKTCDFTVRTSTFRFGRTATEFLSLHSFAESMLETAQFVGENFQD